MLSKEKKCVIAEQVCEAVIGGAMAVILHRTVYPKCNDCVEKAVVALGTGVVGWAVGRAFAKTFYKFCDTAFDTDFEDVYEQL